MSVRDDSFMMAKVTDPSEAVRETVLGLKRLRGVTRLLLGLDSQRLAALA